MIPDIFAVAPTKKKRVKTNKTKKNSAFIVFWFISSIILF